MLSLGLTILVVTWTLHQDFARGVSDVYLVLGFSFEERSLCMFAKFPFANTQLRCHQRCSLGRIIGGATIVREQKVDQGPCCEQLNFRIIRGANAPPPAPQLPTGLVATNIK